MMKFFAVSYTKPTYINYESLKYFTDEQGHVKTFATKRYADLFSEKNGGHTVQLCCREFEDNGDGTLTWVI